MAELIRIGRWAGTRLLALFLLWLGLGIAPGRAVEPDLLGRIRVYRDSSRSLGIEEIAALPPQQWQPPPPHLSFGASRDVIWLRLDLQELPAEPHLWLQRSNLEHVCLYSPGRQWSEHCEGTREPLAQSAYLSPDLVFRLQPQPARYYLRIDSGNLVLLPLRLEGARDFQAAIQHKQMLDMLILGALLATLIFNLLLLIRLQKIAYLYYVLFIITSSVFTFGFLFGYIRLLPQAWHDTLLQAAFPINLLSTWFLLVSMMGFISFKDESLLSYRIMRGLQWLLLGMLPLSLTANRGLMVVAILTKTYLVPLTVLGLLVVSVRKGNRIARLYLAAWTLMTITGFTLVLMYQGVLPYRPASTHVVFAAYVVSILLFSLVLAEQLRLANLDKAVLLAERLELTQSHNRELEDRVRRRTAELQHSLESLDALNRAKDRLFTILAHDLRSPFASLRLMMVMLDKETLDRRQFHELLPRVRRQIDGIYASLENMLQWARIEMDGIRGEAEKIDLQALLDEIVDLYAAAAEQKRVRLELLVPGQLVLNANRHQLHLILRNLVNNALKFTPAGGRVTLEVISHGDEIRIRVSDSGIGMSHEQINALLGRSPRQSVRNGTEGERGIGLGLQLCKAYLEKMGARLEISSQPGQGSTFEIAFPIKDAVGETVLQV